LFPAESASARARFLAGLPADAAERYRALSAQIAASPDNAALLGGSSGSSAG
jgi:hypothetical protein